MRISYWSSDVCCSDVVLTSYAATEFGGGVAGWTLADHRKYWRDKRGSVGRANPGARLRVVDDDGVPQAPGQPGLLDVVPAQMDESTEWLRTNDRSEESRVGKEGFRRVRTWWQQ